MMDWLILLAQIAVTAFPALWLTLGVHDNIRHPMVNEVFTAEVMEMRRMRADFPDAYAFVAHRRIENRKLQLLAFRLVVIWELLATIALWGGVIALGLALFDLVAIDTARALALLGALMFTTTWAMFLAVGNYFAYWFSHDGAQNTHYLMTVWGLGTMIFLAAA